jgi:hypothetical protein
MTETFIDTGRPLYPNYIKIFIGTPFCNEDHSIDKFMESLKQIDYPKTLLDILWIENNSSDNTWQMLSKYYDEFKTYGYNSIRLIHKKGNYKNLIKCEKNEVSSGKVSKNNVYSVRKIRAEHLATLFNFIMDESIRLKCSYCFTLVADVMIPPNIINKFIEDFERIPDCGWIGGAGHKRYPSHKRLPDENPNSKGLGCPIMKILDREPAPIGYKEEWMLRRKKYRIMYYEKKYPDYYPYPYGFYTMTDEDLINRYRIGDGIFECCLVGHAWMVPDYIINKGLRCRVALVESGLDCELQLSKMGYKMYCDSHIYLRHISVDGQVWVDMIGDKIIYHEEKKPIINQIPIQVSIPEVKKLIPNQEIKKLTLPEIKSEIKILVEPVIKKEEPKLIETEYDKYLKCKKRYNDHCYTIPDRPPSNGTIRDPLLNKELNQEAWDKIYGKWVKYMEKNSCDKMC